MNSRAANPELDRLDPELRRPLLELLSTYPGGVYAIEDLAERRRVDKMLADEGAMAARFAQSCSEEEFEIARSAAEATVSVRIYKPAGFEPGRPAILFLHGGGMYLGDLDYEHATAVRLCESLNVLVVSTDYRTAPEHPHPAPVDDCLASLLWMSTRAKELGLDDSRIAIYGGSAGGNLAIATAMKARNILQLAVKYVVALYPMVDHTNSSKSSHEITNMGVWDRRTNIEAWKWFLDGKEPDDYAAPLHASDLSRLPPVFIDVGASDLFRDESIELAQRLILENVPTELHVYPGVYHAAEIYAPTAAMSVQMWSVRLQALRRALEI